MRRSYWRLLPRTAERAVPDWRHSGMTEDPGTSRGLRRLTPAPAWLPARQRHGGRGRVRPGGAGRLGAPTGAESRGRQRRRHQHGRERCHLQGCAHGSHRPDFYQTVSGLCKDRVMERIARLRTLMANENLDAVVLTHPHDVSYTSGYESV